MRTRPSAQWLWACVVAVSGLAAQAQEFAPGGVAPPGFANDAGFAGYGPYGAPDGLGSPASPFPGVSPFANSMEQNYNKGGLWYNETNPLIGRKYTFSLEYLRARLRRPGTDLVGDNRAPPYDEENGEFFRPYDLGVFTEDLTGNGIRGRLVALNPDDSSFEIQAWYIGESEDHFKPAGAGDLNDVENTIRSRGGLPLFDEFGGVTVPFDIRYDLYYKSQANGADLEWYSMPFIRQKNLSVRTTFGLKYMSIREVFRFEGVDSGLTYVLNPDGTVDPTTITDIGVPPYESSLESTARSYLAGPQFGLRAELGNRRGLRFWGHTKLAVAANNERVDLHGDNITDPFTFPLPIPTPGNLRPGYFEDSEEHTHVSPILDTAIFGEIPVFNHLPFFRRQAMFRDAKFRVGYNYILVGEVARPSKVINWVTDQPNINMNRSRWTTGFVSFAVDFKW